MLRSGSFKSGGTFRMKRLRASSGSLSRKSGLNSSMEDGWLVMRLAQSMKI